MRKLVIKYNDFRAYLNEDNSVEYFYDENPVLDDKLFVHNDYINMDVIKYKGALSKEVYYNSIALVDDMYHFIDNINEVSMIHIHSVTKDITLTNIRALNEL